MLDETVSKKRWKIVGYLTFLNIRSLTKIRFATWLLFCISTVFTLTLLLFVDGPTVIIPNAGNKSNANTSSEDPLFTVLYGSVFQENQTKEISNILDIYPCSSNDTLFRNQFFTITKAIQGTLEDTKRHYYSSYPDTNIEELLGNILPQDNSSHAVQCPSNLDLAIFVHIALKNSTDVNRMTKIRLVLCHIIFIF